MSRRLARIAAELLGADENEGDRVRLYQSCVFVKPPGFGDELALRRQHGTARHQQVSLFSFSCWQVD